MEDRQVLNQIEKLFAEEDRLYADPDLKKSEGDRIHKIKIELDQWWDYLRQRRAFRNTGGPQKLRNSNSSCFGIRGDLIRANSLILYGRIPGELTLTLNSGPEFKRKAARFRQVLNNTVR